MAAHAYSPIQLKLDVDALKLWVTIPTILAKKGSECDASAVFSSQEKTLNELIIANFLLCGSIID